MRKKIAVVGSRKIFDEKFVYSVLDREIKRGDEIVSGGALGVDYLAQQYAIEHGLPLKEFIPENMTRKEFLKRNKRIAEYCDRVIALPSKSSRGTWHVVNCARALGKPITVIWRPLMFVIPGRKSKSKDLVIERWKNGGEGK